MLILPSISYDPNHATSVPLFHPQTGMPIIARVVPFSLLQCRNINFAQSMNMVKVHVSSNLFSKAYTSQAFVVVKEEAI